MDFKRLKGVRLKDKTALVRVDFNVPRHKDGSISDDTRIQAAVPTVNYLREKGARVVLLSHFGRPKGKPNEDYSLRFILTRLTEAFGADVYFDDKINPAALNVVPQDAILMLENTRFDAGEENGDDDLAKRYAEPPGLIWNVSLIISRKRLMFPRNQSWQWSAGRKFRPRLTF